MESSANKTWDDFGAEKQDLIIKQVQKEFKIADSYLEPKKETWEKRLKLYNNQKRDQENVGHPLLFTIFNTVLANLYDDSIAGKFGPVEDGDYEACENLTSVAEYDRRLMEKDELDYYWTWDACFYGKGLVLLDKFDRKKMCPIPVSINPATFLRDPRAISINGDIEGNGSARFFGWESGMAKFEMEKKNVYFNLDSLLTSKEINDAIDKDREAKDNAANRQNEKNTEEEMTENYNYHILKWFTIIDGKKYYLELANDKNLVIRFQEYKDELWPIIERSIFPISRDFDGVSIPDLIEDKQRASAVLINLGLINAKASIYPMYLFNKNQIKNPKDLDFDFNKFVPVDGDVRTASVPLQKQEITNSVNFILNLIDLAAQKSVAAPEVSQGVQSRVNRTLGEIQRVEAAKNVRHSLSLKIFGWSEKKFWERWYWLYKKYFKNIDEKILRLEGPLGAISKKLTKDNLIPTADPDIYVESSYIIENKRNDEYQKFMALANMAMQDPQTNRKFVFRKLAKILGRKNSELTLMFPPTIDELLSEDENLVINQNKLPKVNSYDDDIIHVEIHNKATDNKAKFAHIEAHKKMMIFKKINQAMFANQQQQGIPNFKPVQGQQQQQPQQESGVVAEAGHGNNQEEL